MKEYREMIDFKKLIGIDDAAKAAIEAAQPYIIAEYNEKLLSEDCVQFSAYETFKREQERCPSLLQKSPSTMRQECRDYIEAAIQKAGE